MNSNFLDFFLSFLYERKITLILIYVSSYASCNIDSELKDEATNLSSF